VHFFARKAQMNEIYHILIQILIAVMTYIILQNYIDSVAKDTLFEKSYLSKDIGLLINALYAGSGDVEYTYVNDKAELNKFNFGFNEQKVSIVESGSAGKIVSEQPYGEDLNSRYSGQKIYSPSQIIFSRTKERLQISRNSNEK